MITTDCHGPRSEESMNYFFALSQARADFSSRKTENLRFRMSAKADNIRARPYRTAESGLTSMAHRPLKVEEAAKRSAIDRISSEVRVSLL